MSDQQPTSFSFRTIAGQLVARALDVQRVEEAAGGVYQVDGRITLAGYGEVIVAVNFPVTFVESPHLDSGWELQAGSFFQSGGVPVVSGGVKDWKSDIRSDTGQVLYKGASFIIYVAGQPEQVLDWHFGCRGRALRNPL